MTSTGTIGVVIVAAGRGQRAGEGLPKQYRPLAGKTVLRRTVETALAALPDSHIVVVIHPDDRALYDATMADPTLGDLRPKLLPPASGGASRQASTLAGLESLQQFSKSIFSVLIHDAARCFSPVALWRDISSGITSVSGCIPLMEMTDSIKSLADDGVLSAVDRTRYRAAQTPQGFPFAAIIAAHRRAAQEGLCDFTDDAALAQWAGVATRGLPGDSANIKLTTPEDFALAELRLGAALSDIRTGSGYDVHAFGPGDHIWLGGVRIAHTHGLVGHSDADVLLHAITDALLGALADGDIGAHFPPSDPRWKGAASDVFLKDAVDRVARRGGAIAHLDATVVCEAPRVGPHRDAIRARIAQIAGLPLDRVAVKATTSEQLGFTGRREGVAAQALATIRLPAS